MNKLVRLACTDCDTEECNGILEIPASWKDVTEVQSPVAAMAEVSATDKTQSVMKWYTHLGLCPMCQKEED
ncbi:MAG TPA: hypothetical protein PLY87_11560 [Planctomycetaceae bacterium]|nr:hypothetical protein [Planctomycetaceae bacterium]